MSDPGAPGAAERLHPYFLLSGLGGSLRGMAGGYAALGYLAATGRLQTALIGAAVLLVVMAAGLLLYWRRFEYRVGAQEIRIDSGIINRTHRSIPFDRVQDVDISQGPVARLLGIASVKFETGGSAGGNGEDGVLHAIALERAEDLRRLVRASRSAAETATQDPVEAAEQPPIYAMDGRRLLLGGVFNFSLALFGGLAGLTQTMGDVIGFDPLSRRFWRSTLNRGDPLARYIAAHAGAAAVAGVLVLVVIGIGTGIVRSFVRDYGFRLERAATGLRRRRGLITRTDVTLSVKRVQAAIIGSGPVRDRFGWRDLKLQSLARDEGGGGDHVVAPLANDDEVAAILAELEWRPVATDLEWAGVSRAYVWVFALGLSPLLLVAAVESFVSPWLGLAIVAVLAALVIGRWLAWRRTRYALDDDRLLVSSGWWRRRLVILPLARIQSSDIAENFLSRRFGTATLRLGVAGGSGFSAHMIPALPRETARALRRELLV
jgi:putative membrane protein